MSNLSYNHVHWAFLNLCLGVCRVTCGTAWSTSALLGVQWCFNTGLLHPPLLLGQDVTPLATPHHHSDHGQREENRDEDEQDERVVGRVLPHNLLYGAVGEEVLVYVDYVSLHQGVGPVAVDDVGLCLCAEGEEVVLAGETKGRRERSVRRTSVQDPECRSRSF